MSVLATYNENLHDTSQYQLHTQALNSAFTMDPQAVSLHQSSAQPQPARVRRKSLNISHFNALQSAVSELSRIDDYDLEELGYGFFSDVFKVTHKQTGNIMVLKRNKDTNTKMNILREVQLMNRLSHPNILKFKGVCVHEGQLHALTEYINGGDLEQLVTKKSVLLTWKQRVKLALDIANGMKYLHSVGIFHRDLSAKNCLVRITVGLKDKKKYSCVVADLGLAEKIPNSASEEERLSIVGTPYIMAPEVLKKKPYNEKADIFSYGLLVCQLIALVSFDPEELPRSPDFGLARDLFQKMVSASPPAGSCPSTSLPPPEDFLQLGYDCCQFIPKSRPSFVKIVSCLEKIIEKLKRNRVGRSSSVRVAVDTTSHIDQTEQINDKDKVETIEAPVKKRSRSLSSRFSRSFSDISRELLTHAENMVASSSSSDDITIDSDNFANPFATLKHLNGGKIKLTDEPSLALLELTFDLTTTDKLKSSWKTSQTDYVRKNRRSKSVYLMNNAPLNVAVAPPQPSSLDMTASQIRTDNLGCRSVPHSPRGSASEEKLTHCNECLYQRALCRAMVLSPRGNNLASWWCSRHRCRKDSARNRSRQSLAGVMSVLSSNIEWVRRCISLPDLSRITSLFHPLEEGMEKRSFQNTESPRSRRSRTSNEIFHHCSSEEPILEESEAELLKLSSEKALLPSQVSVTAPIAETKNRDSPVPAQIEVGLDQAENRTEHSVSSFGSSICSSSLSITLHSGEVTRQRRLENRSSIPLKYPPRKSKSSDSDLNPSHSPKSQNRDSGYDDGVDDSLHSALSSPGCDVFHPLPWKIPEETVLVP